MRTKCSKCGDLYVIMKLYYSMCVSSWLMASPASLILWKSSPHLLFLLLARSVSIYRRYLLALKILYPVLFCEGHVITYYFIKSIECKKKKIAGSRYVWIIFLVEKAELSWYVAFLVAPESVGCLKHYLQRKLIIIKMSQVTCHSLLFPCILSLCLYSNRKITQTRSLIMRN